MIERVLNFGKISDFKKILKFYGNSKIENELEKINFVDKKNINFWSLIFSFSKEKFECLKKLYQKKHTIWLNR